MQFCEQTRTLSLARGLSPKRGGWSRVGGAAIAATLLAASVAHAQSDPAPAPSTSRQSGDPFAGVEEMIVTGSGMVGALTTTSTSVTSFDAMKLESLGVSNVSDVAAYTPNLEIRTASSTTATFFIRGVGLNDFTANAASAVAVYVDDAPRNLPAIQLGLLYDLEGIEIQKGPQGSGPGRNASAGAIRIYTKKPKGDTEATFKVDFGNYDLIDIEGALELPILEDTLSFRTAFNRRTRDGIVTNRCAGFTQDQIRPLVSLCGETPSRPGVPPIVRAGLEKNLNNTDVWSSRTSLRFLPPMVDDMDWTLVGHVDRVDQLGPVGQHIGTRPTLGGLDATQSYRQPEIEAELNQIIAGPLAACSALPPSQRAACRSAAIAAGGRRLSRDLATRPLDKLPFEGDYNTPGFERQTTGGATLTGDWQIGTLVIKNITGFERYDRERLIDADYSPNLLFEFDIEDDAWQVTEDLRAGAELESLPITWGVGAFYLQEELDYSQRTLTASTEVDRVLQEFVQKTRSIGVFADISWDLLDDLTLDAGARYNWESKSFAADIFRGQTTLTDQCLPGPSGPKPCQRTDTVDHPTGTVGLTYRFDEEREAYFKYSHGWKGLQYNVRDGSVASEVTDVADPEVIDAFEVGMKGGWLDDRITVDAALFWYAYQNYQVFTFTNDPRSSPVRIVINADDAQNFGAEVSTTIKPVEGLTADVRFGWLETKFLDFTDSVSRPVPGGSGSEFFRLVFDYNGNQLPNAPRFKVSGGVEYVFDLNRIGRITPRYDVAWTDEANFDPSGGRGAPDGSGNQSLPDHAISQRPFALHTVTVRYQEPGDRLEMALWIRNLTNEVYKTLSFDASGGPAFVGNLVGDPRTYGMTLKVSF
jgi:iron complex outermembrane recepter protein